MTKRNWLVLLLILPGLIAALILAGQRYGLESRNKSVQLVLDYAELQNLSVSSGTPIAELLERFKSVGVTGVAVTEDLVGDLVATGQIAYKVRPSAAGPYTIVHVPDGLLAGRVHRALSARLNPGANLAAPAGVLDKPLQSFEVPAVPATLNLIGIGLSPDAVQTVKASGLDVIARLQNSPAMTPEGIDAAIGEMRANGINKVICSGDEVLGFRGLIEEAADKFDMAGILYGSVEFAKQRGDSAMTRHLDGRFIRVHSIPAAEMAAMSPGTAVERFARGVKERNIRLCYVRLLESTGEDPVKANAGFVHAIRRAVTDAGYTMGPAYAFDYRKQSPLLLVPIGLSIAAGAVLLLGSLLTLSAALQIGLILAGFVVFAGLIVLGGTGKELAALAAALIFPTLAIVRVYGPYLGREISGSFHHPAVRSTARFVRASAYSLMGAALIAGMLGTRSYMVKVDQFMGIKAAHLLPMLFVVFVMAAGLPMMKEGLPMVWQRMRTNLRNLVSGPLFIWQALALMFVVAIIGLALLRTGNDPGVGVSGIELKFRSLLDKVMVVRPRTKEFLFGHPALILGAAFLFARRRSIGLPLVALGVLGQASLLNTFCHIHTPLALTLLRAFNGLVLGIIIGLAVWWFVGKPIVRATALQARKTDEK